MQKPVIPSTLHEKGVIIMIRKWFLIITVFFIGGCTTVGGVPVSDQMPRMSIEALKARLEFPDTIVLDVRTGWSWSTSNSKIAGAIREDPKEFSHWYDKYPKNKTLVLYCS
jgi:hypothetical protein